VKATIALAPGEEMTLEVHSWVKETVKSERQLVVESETIRPSSLTPQRFDASAILFMILLKDFRPGNKHKSRQSASTTLARISEEGRSRPGSTGRREGS
jgi:hypothetical protein